jgi:hypothetical protein
MWNRLRELCRRVIVFGLLLGGLSSTGWAARGSSDQESSSDAIGNDSRQKIATPMADEGPGIAPYSVRFRITGFLARQHARDGKEWQALVEFYSMLDVDDPVWPDDETGDSMRISRDIEVARMMTEVGFFDHAIRVLHTSMILACINHDPQTDHVERQIRATAALARLKQVPVPDIDMSFLTCKQPMESEQPPVESLPAVESEQPAVESEQPQVEPMPPVVQRAESVQQPAQPVEPAVSVVATESESAIEESIEPSDAPELRPALTGQPSALPRQLTNPPNELPRIKPEPATELPDLADKAGGTAAERSRFSWLTPSRWWQKKEIAQAAAVQESPEPAPPAAHPSTAPAYCQHCSGLPGSHTGNVVVRYNPRTGVTHTHVPGIAGASPMPSPYQKQFAPLKPDNHSTHFHSTPAPAGPRKPRKAQDPRTKQPAQAPEKSAEPPPPPLPSIPEEPKLPTEEKPRLESPPVDPAPAEKPPADSPPSEAVPSNPQEGPSLSASGALEAPSELPARNQVAKAAGVAASGRPAKHVGIAGDVPNPGIFKLQGRSTTLAALLRRTGERELAADKKARILRAVEIGGTGSGSNESPKDIYCQRLESLSAQFGSVETPVYNQEVVIVDGSGERPIYVAVMPHFILQVPFDPSVAVTAEQIVDLLQAQWPDIRGHNIYILRYEQWGRAGRSSRLENALDSDPHALAAGDVVYIDGLGLDRSKVIAAAESIAMMAGAKIRHKESVAKGGDESNESTKRVRF